MRILRVFIKPDNRCWLDIPMPDGVTVPQMMGIIQREQVIVGDDCMIPWSSVSFAATWTTAKEMPKPTVVQGPWTNAATPQWPPSEPPKDPA
jgi:hypothetical protein